MKNKNSIIYEITVEDVQEVADDVLGRELTLSEIQSIEGSIADQIGWYDAIAHAISEKFISN